MINICGQCVHWRRSLVKCTNCNGYPTLVDNFEQKPPVSLKHIVDKTDHKFGSNYNKQGTGRKR